MNNDEQQPNTKPQQEFLNNSLSELMLSLRLVNNQLIEQGNVADEAKKSLYSDLSTVAFLLRQYRSKDNVDWENTTPFENGPDDLLKGLFRGKDDLVQPKGQRGSAPVKVRGPPDVELDVLYHSALDLLDLANELGLMPDVDESTETTYPEPV